MNRNMMNTVDKVKDNIPANYDITIPELQELYEILQDPNRDGKWDALTTAFHYGFALGARAQKAGKFQAK